MTTLLTLYLAGMPCALFTLLWALQGAPAEDLIEVGTFAGLAALTAWIVLWPVFAVICIYDVISER